MRTALPMVGIGASAGGLEAVGELLTGLPPDTGMAFIFVQHLAPDHTSLLTEILSKKTAMPVTEATEGNLIEANHVYIIPPNTTLTIVQGRLRLKPRDAASGLPMPIDDFFHSLAEDQGDNAIGISLSGAGTDGALGIQSIKNEGGITFAQSEKSAQYSSMPHAAARLGCIDFVLSPAEIARELVRISHRPPRRDHSMPDLGYLDSDETDLKRIFELLYKSCNLDFTNYKRGTLKRRLARRLALHNLYNISDYIRFLEANPEEVNALGQDFLIRVTSFFRDPDTFDSLSIYVFPRLIEKSSSKISLRIWVPGCSTGEEVYSLAICCLEYLSERGIAAQIQIFGTDVSETALQTARTGIYVENIARNVSPQRLEKFFVKTGEYYQVAKPVRDLCIFARHDVTSDPPFSRLDMVSCRNLLIYLDPMLQKRVIPLFHYALKPEGVLILGPAENIGGFADIFALDDNKKIRFYIKKSLPERSRLKYLADYPGKALPSPSPSPSPSPPDFLKKKYTEAERQKQEADRITLERFVPAAVLCDKDLNILEFRGDTAPYLAQSSGAPDINLQKLAKPGLLVEISKAVHKSAQEGITVRTPRLQTGTAGKNKEIIIEVIPMPSPAAQGRRFLIFFEDKIQPLLPMTGGTGFWTGLGRFIAQSLKPGGRGAQQRSNDDVLSRSQQELDDTREHIHTMMREYEAAKAELQSSQEELLSNNEEFQSTNEELETAKEELQSANEELLTTNDEVSNRNNALNELNDKLKQALNYAEVIIKTVSQPFLVLDGHLHILDANPAFYKTFKTVPEKTKGNLLYDLGDRQWDIPELRQFLEALVSDDTSFKGCEITHIFPRVGKKTMRLNGRHLVWGGHPQILLAIEDVSDYTTAIGILRDNDQHKDEFLAMLAHELRNPLAPIRNALEIWKSGSAGEKVEKESQMIMGRQLQKMIQLVDDLLDVARITRGVIVLKKEPVDLERVVIHAVESTRQKFDERRHNKIIPALPKENIFVKGDAIRLEQVVSNLLINAAKYTEPGGRIAVALEREENHAVIRITDNGIGIAPAVLPYIFDLFVQANRSLDRKQGGLGLGLTLARRLVELHNGSIEAKSEGLTKGSEFIVRLPLILEEKAAVPAAPSPAAAPVEVPFVARRILVIDDNADAAATTQMLLELKGHKVQIAADGPSGIGAAQMFKPEVILLDIGLPGMDGYEVAQCLRELPVTKNILLIALSGYGQAEDFRKSKEAGFDHHLVKPADIDHLQTLISLLK